MTTTVPEIFLDTLACPCCQATGLLIETEILRCQACQTVFPLVDGHPILIDERSSAFRIDDFVARQVTTMDLDRERHNGWLATLKKTISQNLPNTSYSAIDISLTEVLQLINSEYAAARILVIGAGDQTLPLTGQQSVLYTDVAIGSLTHLVCDAHALPLLANSFDAVIACAVFEHVADPYCCVAEVYRVLKPNGYLFAITPFMQQVHMGRYDFTRFTHLGHRRLFRQFREERSGVANGPAMVLAWSFERFLAGFANNKCLYSKLRILARLLAFPVKYLDYFLARRAAAYDSASAFYFLGRKSEITLSDRELIRLYRGIG